MEDPTPSTSTAGVLDPANLGLIQAQIQQLTRLFNQHLNKSDSTIRGIQSGRVQAKTVPKEEPKDAEPPNDKEQESDTEKCIQSLEDHLAATLLVTPTPEPPNPETQEGDSRVSKDLLNQLESAVKDSLDRWGETADDQDPPSLDEIT